MIATLTALYLQWVSIVGLFESHSGKFTGTWNIPYQKSMMTLEDKITQYDLLYRPATGTTLEVKYPENVWDVARFDNPYFRCPQCDSGQVGATMSPIGQEKMFVFDCYCMGCKAKWRVKIPVILEVDE